ncbi:MAG: hypothetical protein K0R29_865 [Pseudobdellovibrio sp.]|jgi:hypothetical protein|nr:hypothetical protein [Pseudobdellovibrio sp.]
MTVNPLPPQAYTKETLQKAYSWLLTQNASVKEMATSQEILVSLYLKAQRSGDAALETPSIQNFKQELKSLASMMGDLQSPQAQAMQAQHTQFSQPSMTVQQPAQQQRVRNSMPQTFAPSAPSFAAPSAPSSASTSTFTLDDQSMQAIQDVKHALNLSTDSEALRALISLGYRQFRKL